jgi:AAA family ATP:ADP antiporter
VIYAKLSNSLSRENVFYSVVFPFLIFFGIFGFLIQPNVEVLHFSGEAVTAAKAGAPKFFHNFINVFSVWGYSVFYVLSEIWGSAMVALLFWQFANEVTMKHEIKRFYGLFAVVGNAALVFSGQFVKFCSNGVPSLYPELSRHDSWCISVKLMMGSVVVLGLISAILYRDLNTNVLTNKKYFDPDSVKTKRKKEKPSLLASLRTIMTSSELGYIAVLIIAYGITINLVEVQWKQQLKIMYKGDIAGYNSFMGDYSTYTGIFAIFFGLFIGSKILQKFSWLVSALITPVTILIGGSLFFIFIISKDLILSTFSGLSFDPVIVASLLGAAIVIASKVVKYTLFDPTKEMAYIPLSEELKVKGKAAVDVIGGRAGKSGGSAIQIMLLSLFSGGVTAIAPYVAISFLVFASIWILSVGKLSKKIAALEEDKDEPKEAMQVAKS